MENQDLGPRRETGSVSQWSRVSTTRRWAVLLGEKTARSQDQRSGKKGAKVRVGAKPRGSGLGKR